MKVSQSYLTLQPHGLWPARLLCPRDFPSKHTGVGSHPLLQGILSTQELSPGLLLCKWILYHLSHTLTMAKRGMAPTAQNDGVLLEGSNPLPAPYSIPQ